MPDPDPNLPPEQQPPNGWELLCDGILRTQFGRRPSRAVDKAIMLLAAEEASAKAPVARERAASRGRFGQWLSGLIPRPALALGAAFALVMIVGFAFWFRIGFSRTFICTFSDELDARWAGKSPRLKLGEHLAGTSFRLESGAAELTFASTARVAVEGPAQFKLIDGNSMELESGKLSAEVPPRARGFSVKTPSATVIDLGTRFGTIVDSNRLTEIDVFQGRVQVTAGTNGAARGGQWRLAPGMGLTADANGATTGPARSETVFPRPSQIVLALPQNCGFDAPGHTAVGDVPVLAGIWSGPAFSLTTATQGIRPYSGDGMLRFGNPSNPANDSEVWQVVDMRPFKALLADGSVQAKLSAYFNRLHKENGAGDKFGLTLAAFQGAIAEAPALWASRTNSALALADSQLTADDNPATWEKIEVSAKLPPETDFLLIELRAVAPKTASGKSTPFPGHFADLVDLKLCTSMRSSFSLAGR